MTTPTPSAPPLRGKLIRGAAWMVATKWGLRLMGMVSTVILARLLVPEDFGLIAMTMVVVSSVNIVFEFGVDYALITSDKADRSMLDTGWSLRLIQAIAAGLIMLAVIPFLSHIYDDERVSLIMLMIAVATMVRGFKNIGIVLFRRELQFHREFYYEIIVKIISMCCTLALAFWLRSYWALVYGIIIGYIAEVILSYVLQAYRPRWCMEKFDAIWSFSKWMLTVHIANHIALRFDRMFIGSVATPATVGYYSIGGEIANMAGPEITAPVSRALVPGFSKLRNEPKRLDNAYLKTLAASAIIGIPASMGLALIAPELIPIALGTAWDPAVPIIQILCFFALLRTIMTACSNLGMVTGQIGAIAKISIVRAVLTPIAFWFAYSYAGVFGVAVSKTVLMAIHVTAIFALVLGTRDISVRAISEQLWRPLVAAAIMCIVVHSVGVQLINVSMVALLLSKIAAGTFSYVGATAGLWAAAGRPKSIESDLLELIHSRLRSKR